MFLAGACDLFLQALFVDTEVADLAGLLLDQQIRLLQFQGLFTLPGSF